MVVWVFAGGGESEVAGLIPFLQKNFPGCKFERKTPAIKKPGAKPGRVNSYGNTGRSLIEQIKKTLPVALQKQSDECDLILVFDDLDCREPVQQRQSFFDAISNIPESKNINKFIGFAAPELESWIIADWNNSIARHPKFRGRHQRMQWWLSTQINIPFDSPESFSEYDTSRDCCQEKLSEALINSSVLPLPEEALINSSVSPLPKFDSSSTRYSKGLHTPELLVGYINPDEVQKKCPLFRELYIYLQNFCGSS